MKEININEENLSIEKLNEIFLNVHDGLEPEIENSIYYYKLKHLLFQEINLFCKEFYELKEDLNILRSAIGETLSEKFIREYAEDLKLKYNTEEFKQIALEYHIEQTRIDYGLIFFIIIQRGNNVNCKKFVFRFRKNVPADGISTLTTAGILKENFMKRKNN